MSDVTSRNQPAPIRRPIVLRTPGQDAAAASEPGLVGSEGETELQSLREEVASCRQSLEQWTQAEVEWSQQRRLFQIMTENVSDLIVLLDHQGN